MDSLAADPGHELRTAREDYRQWAERQDGGRYERIDGVVDAMVSERADLVDRMALVWLALGQAR
jgi:hypothetical protein